MLDKKVLKTYYAAAGMVLAFIISFPVASMAYSDSNLNIDKQYIEEKVLKELHKDNVYKSDMKEKVQLLVSDGTFSDVYNMYKSSCSKDFTENEILDMTIKNISNKVECEVDDKLEFKSIKKEILQTDDMSEESDDKWGKLFKYIQANLSPNYKVCEDSVKNNIDILKKNIDRLPPEVKKAAEIYIMDKEISLKFQKENPDIVREYSVGTEKKIEKRPKTFLLAASNSQRKAQEYANRYYKNYNKAYPDWNSYGGDCANFVSQCLYAGDKVMKNFNGNVNDSSNWFSYGNITDPSRVAGSWRGANMFKWHWANRAYGFKDFFLSDPKAIRMIYDYADIAYPVSVFKEGSSTATHTMIINGFFNKDKDVSLAQHTGSRNNKRAANISKNYVLRVYKIY